MAQRLVVQPLAQVQLVVVVALTLHLLPTPRQHHNLQALTSARKASAP